MRARAHTHTHTHAHTHTHTHTHTLMHTFIPLIQIHTRIRECAHTHTHTHTPCHSFTPTPLFTSNIDQYFPDLPPCAHNDVLVYVGATRDLSDNHFTWNDGSLLLSNSSLWGNAEPSDIGGNTRCVMFSPVLGGLLNIECDCKCGFVCQVDG